MAISHELTEIRQTMEDELDPKAEREAERTGKSRWNVYEKTLRTVERTAEPRAMRDLSAWIKNVIRERGELPAGEEVREEGRRVCRDLDYEVEPDSWLHP
ncbi:hypothetical protein [Halomicrococcus sp. NG-SE-24]|uniref:hypothetical protein n=1 Tax=Halomicrococcus sp. NG-SE-24 TaxID=3436928 RepID=UPI003D951A62